MLTACTNKNETDCHLLACRIVQKRSPALKLQTKPLPHESAKLRLLHGLPLLGTAGSLSAQTFTATADGKLHVLLLLPVQLHGGGSVGDGFAQTVMTAMLL